MAALNLAQKSALLAGTSLFSSLAEKDIESMASASRMLTLKARSELFHKGDEGAQIYIVASGKLKVITTSKDGDDLMFCVLDEGEVIGEIGLLAERARTATVVAVTNCELIVIDRRDFYSLLRARPAVALELLTVLARRVARVSEFVEDTHFLNLPVRLAKKLRDFANSHGKPISVNGVEGLLIDVKLSQEEWGDLVGTTRESVNKQFRSWVSEDIIRLEKGRVVICKREEIERLADCVVI